MPWVLNALFTAVYHQQSLKMKYVQIRYTQEKTEIMTHCHITDGVEQARGQEHNPNSSPSPPGLQS